MRVFKKRWSLKLGVLMAGSLGPLVLCGLVFIAIFPQLALYSDTRIIRQDLLPHLIIDRCNLILFHQQLMVTESRLGTIWDRLPDDWQRDPGGPMTQDFGATIWREIPYLGRMRSHSEYQNDKSPKRILMTNSLYVEIPGCSDG
jgi:hypothetical protein